MACKAITIALVAVLLHANVRAQIQPQLSVQNIEKMKQVLRKAHEKNKSVKVTLNNKIANESKLIGKPSEVSDGDFVLTDQKTGRSMILAYRDVGEVRQQGWSTGKKIGIGVLVFVVVIVVVLTATKAWVSE